MEEVGERLLSDSRNGERDDGDFDDSGMAINMLLLPPHSAYDWLAQVLDNYDSLIDTANALAELDVATAFADFAHDKHWTKPVVDDR